MQRRLRLQRWCWGSDGREVDLIFEGKNEDMVHSSRIDRGSLALKSLILLTFIFIYGILLLGDNITTVHFLFPNCVVLLAILIAVLLIRKCKITKKRAVFILERHENACLLLFSLTVLAVQFLITYNIIFQTSWDVAAVWYGAHWAEMGDATGLLEMSDYYSIYPNNLLLVYIFSMILRLNRMLGEPISNGGLLLAFIQCGVVTFSGAVMFKCAKRFVGVRARWGAYLLYVFLIALSPWIVLPYSDGMGIVFPVLFLYLYLRCKEHSGNIGKIVFVFILFALAVIAYHIKPYSVIVLIAVSLVEGVEWLIRIVHRESHIKIINIIVAVVALFALFSSSALIYYLNHSMGFKIDEERRMGISHYLMIGANENSLGGFSDGDLEFSESLYDKKDRTKAELTEFRDRIHSMGIIGYAKFFTLKAAKNFCDGTFGWGTDESFYTEVYPSRGKASDLLRSLYYGYGELYPYHAAIRQCLWIFVLITIPFVALTVESFDVRKKVLALAVWGFILYLQIFESHARYVYVFAPLFLIMSAIGVSSLQQRKDFSTNESQLYSESD